MPFMSADLFLKSQLAGFRLSKLFFIHSIETQITVDFFNRKHTEAEYACIHSIGHNNKFHGCLLTIIFSC